MSKVICNSIGSTHLCNGCGAAKPHYRMSCEPCPANDQAKCIEVAPEKRSRCCGRCNGWDDICVADTVCEPHKEMGCEVCFGAR